MNRLIANRATEKDIRDWLTNNGYYGRTANFLQLELHAIQRPGWKQVYRFSVEAKKQVGDDEPEAGHSPGRETLYGVVRDDERNEIRRKEAASICVFTDEDECEDFLASCSEGMLVRGTRTSDNPVWIVCGGLLLLFIVIVVLRLFS